MRLDSNTPVYDYAKTETKWHICMYMYPVYCLLPSKPFSVVFRTADCLKVTKKKNSETSALPSLKRVVRLYVCNIACRLPPAVCLLQLLLVFSASAIYHFVWHCCFYCNLANSWCCYCSYTTFYAFQPHSVIEPVKCCSSCPRS